MADTSSLEPSNSSLTAIESKKPALENDILT